MLQYVVASFHLPSVTTDNINKVQYPKPYKQYEIPTIPALVMSEVLLPQSTFMAAFVHCHSSLFLMPLHACQHRAIIMSHNLQVYLLWSCSAELSEPYPKCQTANLKQYNSICFGHLYAHLQELFIIINKLLHQVGISLQFHI